MDAEQESVNLKLCLYGGKEANIEKSFSPSTTLNDIQHEMRRVFNVDTERETKLWINGSVYAFKPDNNGIDNGTSENNNLKLSSEAKENNGVTSLHNDATSTGSLSPISPARSPPSPPPMPANSSVTTSSALNNNTLIGNPSPNVVTRQAAQFLSKQVQQQQQPIALPDSTTINSMLTTSDSPTSSSVNKEANPLQTLSEAGIADTSGSTIVTLEVVNADGTWPSSRPRFGASTRSSKAQPGLCGLSNMGNTCFMNAALQCLSNSPPLTNYILTDKFVNDINTNNPLGMQGEIARTYAELIKVIWSGNHSSFLPREFKCAVSRFAPQFTGFAQQDCQELMAFLLDGLHEDLNRIKNKPYIEVKNDVEKRPDEDVAKESWENYKKRNDSIVVDTFHAMLKSTLDCPECKLISVTFDPFCYLSLPLPVKRERQVSLTFLPAPAKIDESKIKTLLTCLEPEEAKLVMKYGGKISSFDGIIEEHAGYACSSNRPKSCKMQVPRSGPASELCDIVAQIINEDWSSESRKIQSDNLVVVEMVGLGRISKIYESSEHYNQISDEIVVIEKAADHVLPLYLKEDRSEACITESLSKLLFLHVPDLKYETLYHTVTVNLSNLTADSKEEISQWCSLAAPTLLEHPMECDDVKTKDDQEMGDCNGKTDGETNGGAEALLSHKPAFTLETVNSHGNHSYETLGPSSTECDSSKLYLAATFKSSGITSMPQFEHNRASRSDSFEVFTPRVSPKPTLQLKDCITQFTNAERLGADDPWYCPKCKKHQQAFKKFDVWSLPKVLIIHLKRFSFSRSWRDKIDTLVEFPVEGLDMSGYVHNPEQKKQQQIYDLIGVANHFGGLGGGHYTAYAKNAPLNAWYSFDDALVSPTSANNVVTRSAYVLFYQLRED